MTPHLRRTESVSHALDDDTLVVPVGATRGAPVRNDLATVWSRWNGFRPAPALAADLVAAGLDPDTAASTLQSWLEAGLLESAEAVGRGCRSDGEIAPPPIVDIGILTCDRPALVARAVSAWREWATHVDRTVRLTVVDDTLDPSIAVQVRDLVGAADDTARFLGIADRLALADRVASLAGVSVDVVRWALVGPEAPRFGAGSGRNTLAFCLAGRRAVTADDDILPRFARPPGHLPGWRLTSRVAFETWYFDDPSGPEAFASFGLGDPIAEAERCVGRAVGDVIPPTGVSRFEAVGLALTRRLRCGLVRVPCATIGIAGDSGTSDALAPLMALGATGERALDRPSPLGPSREVARTSRMATLTDHPALMGGFRIEDHRTPLAPYFASGRGEDDTQARLLRWLEPESVTAVLPWLAMHRPPGPRAWNPADFVAAPQGISDQLAVSACIGTCPEPANGVSAATRRQYLGSHLAWVGRLPSREFDTILADGWHGQLAASMRSITAALESWPQRPAWWQHTLRAALVAHRRAPRDPALTDRQHQAAPSHALQNDIRRFGELLHGLDGIHDIARRLPELNG